MTKTSPQEEKTLDTVVQDIYGLFEEDDHKVSDDNLDKFCDNLKQVLKQRLENRKEQQRQRNSRPTLRASNIGLGDMRLWYESRNVIDEEADTPFDDPSLPIRFLYGDIIEELVLFLVREAGHSVSDEQKEIEIEGILGHKDCKIDGITTDIKSASKFSFAKFSQGKLLTDDPFGYIGQISAYTKDDPQREGAFLAMNKETGELALLKIGQIDMIDPVNRIKHLKRVLKSNTPPETKCYEPVDYGKSGNKVLHKNCSYCPFKDDCWASANDGKGLRKFRYSNGVKEFVEVKELPKVEEIISTDSP